MTAKVGNIIDSANYSPLKKTEAAFKGLLNCYFLP